MQQQHKIFNKHHLWNTKKTLMVGLSALGVAAITAFMVSTNFVQTATVFDFPIIVNSYSSSEVSQIPTVVYPLYDDVQSRIDYLVNEGIEFAEQEKYNTAIDYFDQAIWEGMKVGIADPAPLIEKGSVLHKMGKFSEALVHFDNAIEIDPDNSIALKKKGTTLAQLGELDKAKYYFETALKPKM